LKHELTIKYGKAVEEKARKEGEIMKIRVSSFRFEYPENWIYGLI